MRPRYIGRALGIGVRIAGRIAGQRIAGSAQSAASAPHVNAQSVVAANRVAQVQSQARAAASVAAQTSRGSRSRAHSSFCSQPSSHCVFGRAGQGLGGCRGISRSVRRWFFSTWESLLSGARSTDKADLRVESFASAKSLAPRAIGQTGCVRASSTGRWGPRPRRSQTPRRQTQ